jgi:hypothetical protein
MEKIIVVLFVLIFSGKLLAQYDSVEIRNLVQNNIILFQVSKIINSDIETTPDGYLKSNSFSGDWVNLIMEGRRQKHSKRCKYLILLGRGKKKASDWRLMLLTLAVWTGLEPATPCVTGMYSNQLNYQTNFLSSFKDLTSVRFRNCVMLFVKSACKDK